RPRGPPREGGRVGDDPLAGTAPRPNPAPGISGHSPPWQDPPLTPIAGNLRAAESLAEWREDTRGAVESVGRSGHVNPTRGRPERSGHLGHLHRRRAFKTPRAPRASRRSR